MKMLGDYEDLVFGRISISGRAPDFIVVVAMGNDVLWDVTYPLQLRDDGAHLASVAQHLSRIRGLVRGAAVGLFFGGSSDLFGYTRDAHRYDRAIGRVVDMVTSDYDFVDDFSGLIPLATIDDIGHIRQSEVSRVVAYMGRVCASCLDMPIRHRSRM